MLKWLTTTKSGFTIVELVVVLLLLSLGVVALVNLFQAGYRAYDKSEERYVKQEAVKTAATLLRTGSTSVAAAQSADIFNTAAVVPTGESVDDSYSYLYAEEHLNEDGVIDGYYVYVLDKGKKRSAAKKISDEPIYITIRPYEDQSIENGPIENQCGVIITLSALEEDYEYAQEGESRSDYIYYSLDVAYHFPNMVTGDSGVTVNYVTKTMLSSANTYAPNGNITQNPVYATECNTTCSVEHCGCTKGEHPCKDCDCICPNKEGIVLRVYCDSILSGDNTNTEVAIPKLCFIATASYGYDSGEVGLLCEFRDKCLLTNPIGEAFVKTYYKLSPPVADIIAENEHLAAAVRVALKPLVATASYALDSELFKTQGLPMLMVFMLCGAGASALLVSMDKKRKQNKE